MSIYTIEPKKFIDAIAEKLKIDFKDIVVPPKGSEFWKTAHFKELAPVDHENFWYVRCASLLRKVKKYGPIGVNRLRKHYGGKNRKSMGLAHSGRSAGKIIRVALQQLENANLIQKTKQNGRLLSPEGTAFIERHAYASKRQATH